jgi:alkylresorcinol/alkylpyrone synthase
MLLGEGEQGDGPSVIASQVHQVPDSLDAVCMQCAPQDSYLHLIRELPDVAGEHVGGLVERFLARQGMTGHMIDHWIIHPGGRRIIECAQQALRLPDEHVRISFELLADRGNVGTPSIFYVIAETIRQRQPRADEHGLVVTIGPGVSIGLMLLRW